MHAICPPQETTCHPNQLLPQKKEENTSETTTTTALSTTTTTTLLLLSVVPPVSPSPNHPMDFGCSNTHTGDGLPFESGVYPDGLQDFHHFDDAFDYALAVADGHPSGFDLIKALSSPPHGLHSGMPVEGLQSRAGTVSSGYPQISLSDRTGPDPSQSSVVLNVEPLMAFWPPDELSCMTGDNKPWRGGVKMNSKCTPVKKSSGRKTHKKPNVMKGQWTLEEDRYPQSWHLFPDAFLLSSNKYMHLLSSSIRCHLRSSCT